MLTDAHTPRGHGTGMGAPLKKETCDEPWASVTACPGRQSPLHAGVSCCGAPLLCPGDGRRAPAAVRHARVTFGQGDARGDRGRWVPVRPCLVWQYDICRAACGLRLSGFSDLQCADQSE